MQEADRVLFTGMIDEFFDYRYGELAYRSLRFETETLSQANYQGNAVMNFTDAETPYTRIIEHKFFDLSDQPHTVVTWEYPAVWKRGDEPYYPVNDEENSALYEKYTALAAEEPKVLFGGRLGLYRYYDMDDTVEAALKMAEEIVKD